MEEGQKKARATSLATAPVLTMMLSLTNTQNIPTINIIDTPSPVSLSNYLTATIGVSRITKDGVYLGFHTPVKITGSALNKRNAAVPIMSVKDNANSDDVFDVNVCAGEVVELSTIRRKAL
jgi:hypothetical protein